MIKRSISEITKMIEVLNDTTSFADTVINGVCIDTRKIVSGNLFIPFVGENTDGHKYVEMAFENGAVASLWKKDVPNPPTDLPIIIVEDTLLAIQQLASEYRKQLKTKFIGITGSNGKTTTKDILYHLLSSKYKVQKTEGNYNNHLGLPLTILQLEEDTDFSVLEMGMSGKGEIKLLTEIAQPEAVIITNIGESHLLHLGSRKAIAEAKLEIIEGLSSGGTIAYYGDEPLLSSYFKNFTRDANLVTFGFNSTNSFQADNVEQVDNGNYFTVSGNEGQFYLPILGRHNILNALAAISIATTFKISVEEIRKALVQVELTNMRMEMMKISEQLTVINDAYNASPTSMLAAIDLISSLPNFENKIVVLGDILELGPVEEQYHVEIGEAINKENISYVFTYGRLGEKIAQGALLNFPADRVYSFDNKTDLVANLKTKLKKNSLILIKGSRGMQLEEVVERLE